MVRLIDRLGGLAATHELHRAGYTRTDIAAAVRRRRIVRARQGWYARPDTDRTALSVARVGGRATCVTGLRMHGIWVPPTPGLHVACAAHDARLRSRGDSRIRLSPSDDVRVHWRELPAGRSRLLLPKAECLRDSLTCLDPVAFAQCADSLLHRHPDLRVAWATLRRDAPHRMQATLEFVDGRCESGIETRVWLHLRQWTQDVRRQVEFDGIGRVDFVVGDSLIIEADGEAYHTDELQFEEDRRRDAALAALGYRVLRFSYRQVMDRWAEVTAAIAAALPLTKCRSSV